MSKRPHQKKSGGNRAPGQGQKPRYARPGGAPARRPAQAAGRRGPTASASAAFEIAGFRRFLDRLGMPDTLVAQLDAWIHGLDINDEPEQMDAELMWDGSPATLSLVAAIDEQSLAYVEMIGPESLIEEIQAEMDAFFGKARP